MNLGSYFKSPQFQWSAYQAFLAFALVLLAATASYVGGQTNARTTIAGLILSLIPILKRLQEGVADAARDASGAVIASDVTPNPTILTPPLN